ncbi:MULTISPECIES: AAA family ATPase [unclassified Methanoregula]|uniref:ATP-binding protein n=1 Tax=unclassified Methanoregula TaxID=2649730 RepID=UPI0009CD6407|nr:MULTISPECIES: AAA family ATPase [unclassified Methanoregula]OPX61835.1 MAG: Light-independent protochlorophyllide reductase iron-sulfur ATP-binding protein [Methanoregula sp. PtaB.Bin085]OPY35081.1 MAG: Light-independent protochlorophyllide reductase iron-sulfur ATP-binding protein [Methanoregula sp. PtaU1.Bin006]
MIRIIATGKGGAGKTTVIATMSRLLSREGYRVLVIDTDPSMNLAMSLGIPFTTTRTLAEDKTGIREQLLGDDPEDGHGHNHEHNHPVSIDQLLRLYEVYAQDNVRVLVMGTIPYGGAGCICSSISLVKTLIEQIASRIERYDFIIIDSQAGSEILGRGLAVDYDYNLVVTEAFPKSMEVARHVMKLAGDLRIKKQVVVVNKVKDGNETDLVLKSLCLNAEICYPVRYDERVAEADRNGQLILDTAPDSWMVGDIKEIMNMIQVSCRPEGGAG